MTDIILSASPGSGKSVVALSLARLLSPAVICTSRVGLLPAYKAEGLATLAGMGQYRCLVGEVCDSCPHRLDCRFLDAKSPCPVSEAPCVTIRKYDCDLKRTCPYYVGRVAAQKAPIVAVSTAYLLHSSQGDKPLIGKRTLAVIDESHNLEREVSSLLEWTLTEKAFDSVWDDQVIPMYKRAEVGGTLYASVYEGEETPEVLLPLRKGLTSGLLQARLPEALDWESEDKTLWAMVLHEHAKVTENLTDGVDAEIEAMGEDDDPGERSKLNRLLSRLRGQQEGAGRTWRALLKDPGNVVISFPKDAGPRKTTFRMVDLAGETKPLLEKIAGLRVHMSATPGDPATYVRTHGLDPEKTALVEIEDCPFPVENRVIHYYPAGSTSIRRRDRDKWRIGAAVAKIVEQNPGKRVLVLPAAYWLAEELELTVRVNRDIDKEDTTSAAKSFVEARGLKWPPNRDSEDLVARVCSERLFMQPRDQMLREMALALYDHVPDAVMVSVYLGEGFDGAGDRCRVLIVPRTPWPDMTDKVTAAKLRRDKKWYYSQAASSLIQSSMRGVRAIDDSCSIWIVDSSMETLWANTTFPRWFAKAFRKEDLGLPEKEERGDGWDEPPSWV